MRNRIITRLAILASLFLLLSTTTFAQVVPNIQVYGQIEYWQGQEIVDYAQQFLGAPYRYGGNSLTKGIDCSHFVWQVLKNTGFYSGKYHCSRTFHSIGQVVSSIEQAKPGDIIIYSHHLAIYDGNGKIIQALYNPRGISHIRSVHYSKILGIRRFYKDKK